jgi:hypothetical protein
LRIFIYGTITRRRYIARKASSGNPFQGNLLWYRRCIVPEGKEPGMNASATVFFDITRETNCNNLSENDVTCNLTGKRCPLTKTSSDQLAPHAVLHIKYTPNPSQGTLQKALGRGQAQASRVVTFLKRENVVRDGGRITSEVDPQVLSKPPRRLELTGIPLTHQFRPTRQ